MFCRLLISKAGKYIRLFSLHYSLCIIIFIALYFIGKISLSQEHAGALKSSSGDLLCRCKHTNGPSCGLVILILAEHSTPSQCSDTLRDAKGLHGAHHDLRLST